MSKKIFVEETIWREFVEAEGPDDRYIEEVKLCQYDLDEFRELVKTHSGSFDETGYFNGYHQASYWFNGDFVECKVFEKILGA